MANGQGDRLARGAKSAQFGGTLNHKSQIEWDWMWMKAPEFRRTYGISRKKYEEMRDAK